MEQREGEGVGTNLIKEAAALSSLQHPNIVSVYDLDEIDGEPCVVMEFLNGETLEQTMRRGALNLTDFGAVARQSMEGLVAAHRLGVQHRDLKPSNFMVNWLPNGDFLVKMLDFGLADFSSRPHQQVAEGAEETYGSVHFMAPEQFLRHPVDVRTDLYSLGCVLYYALTAKYPFDGRTMEQIIEAHLKTIPTPVNEMRGDASQGLSEWVAWLMSRDPQHRPQSAEEALEMFLQVQAGKVKTLGKSRMLKTQQVVKPVTTTVRPGPSTDRPARTGSVPTRPAPRAPSPAIIPTQKPSGETSSAPVAILTVKPATKKLGLIAGISLAAVALGVVVALILQRGSGKSKTTSVEAPPVPNAFLWARADIGVKTDKASRAAKFGEPLDWWADSAPAGGENPIHYINTASKEAERLARLPDYKQVNLNGTNFPVVSFKGQSCLLLATEDSGNKDIAKSTAENSAPELTYGIICRAEPTPGKMVLLANAGLKQKALWELYLEKQNVCLGSPGNTASVPIPAGTQFMGILMSVSTPKQEGQLAVSFSKNEPVSSPLIKELLVDAKVVKVRLGAVANSVANSKTFFIGDIAEVQAYQRWLSNDERQLFHQYFVKKYLP